MINLEQLRDPEQNIFMKRRITGVWEGCSVAEVLANRIYPERIVLDQQDKSIMPVLGFNRKVGLRSNEQLFPTHFIVLELDTPAAWKAQIKAGDKKTLQCARAVAHVSFWEFHYHPDLPFYWLYLTPSTCGLRFVLRTNEPIIHEAHYRQEVLRYLRLLYRLTNGRVHMDYHDIRVHQAWFVPVFLEEFSAKEQDWIIEPYQEQLLAEVPAKVIQLGNEPKWSLDVQADRFRLAVVFTERSFSYTPGQRNNYIHHLACNCNRFGLPKDETIALLLAQYDLPEKEIRATVSSVYRNQQHEHGQFINR